jgi:hypothetical protein
VDLEGVDIVQAKMIGPRRDLHSRVAGSFNQGSVLAKVGTG